MEREDEGIEFLSSRLQSTISSNYELKQLKNETANKFINIYENNKGKITPELKEAACRYDIAHSGILEYQFEQSQFDAITNEKIEEIHKIIKKNAKSNFINFYKSYRRKIEIGYRKEFIDNALKDLKVAYSIYRKSNNPFWNLTSSQITETEMENLYNLFEEIKKDNTPKTREDE